MERFTDSSDRRPAEILLFALGFAGFGMGLGGAVLELPALAVLGVVLLLLALSGFRGKEP